MIWSVSDAKARLSQLITQAQIEPQTIGSHGKAKAVIMSAQEFDKILRLKQQYDDLIKIQKKDRLLKIQSEISAEFEEKRIDEIDFSTPTRELPEFEK